MTAGIKAVAPNNALVSKAPPNQLRALRERAGLSRAELAVRLSVGEPTITRWELRYGAIPQHRLPALARTLGTSVDELMLHWPEWSRDD